MAVTITYSLTGAGWAVCWVEVGDQRAHLSASYLSDALGDLLRAVVDILAGARESGAAFLEEPGEFRWRFISVGEYRLRVRILQLADWSPRLPDERGSVLLDTECRLRTFAGAVLAASQRLLVELGEEGYSQQWGEHPFPTELQERLKRLLDQGAGRAA